MPSSPVTHASSPPSLASAPSDRTKSRVALVHHWLVGMRGGEKVLEALCELFPQADIYTMVCDRSRLSAKLLAHQIFPSMIQKMPGGLGRFRAYLPLFPMAARKFDFSGYDLVVSSDAAIVKTIMTPPGVPHVCYCHSPPRYLWDMYDLYRKEEANALQRMVMPLFINYLRNADLQGARGVTHFVANSCAVAERIERIYQRKAQVIYPPAETAFYGEAKREPADYYLFVGQLVAYKKASLAVDAIASLGEKLIVVGDGPQREKLQRQATSGVQFKGWVSDDELRNYYAKCRALIFPNEEDFGIVPVEAQAAGAPVICFARGGGLETVIDGVTGVHFAEQTVAGLVDAINKFESRESEWNPQACRDNAGRFTRSQFLAQMGTLVDEVLATSARPRRGVS